MKILEPTLRALAEAGSVKEVIAQRSTTGSCCTWQLLVVMDTTEEYLQLQRGGVREFKTLDSIASLIISLGLDGLRVNFNH